MAASAKSERFRSFLGFEVLLLLVGGLFCVVIMLVVQLAMKPTTRDFNDLQKKYTALVGAQPKPTARRVDQPPMIRLAESEGYRFPSGSANVSEVFTSKLQHIVPQIVAMSRSYDVDTIEVVGHTDGVPVRGAMSTLDTQLAAYINGTTGTPPTAGSNVDLGMTRAAAVARILKADSRLTVLNIVVHSAGQTVLANGTSAAGADLLAFGDDRRRIEIRLRRTKQ